MYKTQKIAVVTFLFAIGMTSVAQSRREQMRASVDSVLTVRYYKTQTTWCGPRVGSP